MEYDKKTYKKMETKSLKYFYFISDKNAESIFFIKKFLDYKIKKKILKKS